MSLHLKADGVDLQVITERTLLTRRAWLSHAIYCAALVHTVTVRYEYMYRATPTCHTFFIIERSSPRSGYNGCFTLSPWPCCRLLFLTASSFKRLFAKSALHCERITKSIPNVWQKIRLKLLEILLKINLLPGTAHGLNHLNQRVRHKE